MAEGRARVADPFGGMWEAADVQWSWRRPRATDELALPVWFDEVGPVAAAGLTDRRPHPKRVSGPVIVADDDYARDRPRSSRQTRSAILSDE
jgi:hypothetical protein